jgi:hypothetical protein
MQDGLWATGVFYLQKKVGRMGDNKKFMDWTVKSLFCVGFIFLGPLFKTTRSMLSRIAMLSPSVPPSTLQGVKWNGPGTMCSPAATWETSTVVLDRLNVITDRLHVISSGSVVYMKIWSSKSMFPRGPSGSNIWSLIRSENGRNVDCTYIHINTSQC